MSALSDAAEVLALNFLFNNQTATRPTAWYLALFTSAPSDSGGGTEVSGSGYARQAITFGAASSPGGTTSNTGVVDFTASGGDWGTVTSAAVFTASTSGTMLIYGNLAAPKTVNDGDTLSFAIGAGNITLA
ncbi:phage tail fiber protein [Metarhizobium album]|uniref:phage tail fiber protein n=1 Tax=Metarhizobium album TaxID=2182425 RepID=UPI000FFF6483|nr:hypothetical protein [Rhizobium album]